MSMRCRHEMATRLAILVPGHLTVLVQSGGKCIDF